MMFKDLREKMETEIHEIKISSGKIDSYSTLIYENTVNIAKNIDKLFDNMYKMHNKIDTIIEMLQKSLCKMYEDIGTEENVEVVLIKTYRDDPILYVDGKKVDTTRYTNICVNLEPGSKTAVELNK